MIDEVTADLETLMRKQFDLAKRLWSAAFACRLLVVIVGATSVFFNTAPEAMALAAALLTILYALLQWWSGRMKSIAETILRKTEMFDGLGWPITGRELSDLMATIPRAVKKQAATRDETFSKYFASKTPQSSRRLLENLEESSWLTKHQARRMSQYVSVLSLFVLVVSIVALAISLQSALTQTTASNIAQVALSTLVFIFSGGYVWLAFDYNQFSQDAAHIEGQAHNLLQSEQEISTVSAIKLLHDYQVVRANAPMLPTWLWQRMQNELNALWLQYRRHDL